MTHFSEQMDEFRNKLGQLVDQYFTSARQEFERAKEEVEWFENLQRVVQVPANHERIPVEQIPLCAQAKTKREQQHPQHGELNWKQAILSMHQVFTKDDLRNFFGRALEGHSPSALNGALTYYRNRGFIKQLRRNTYELVATK